MRTPSPRKWRVRPPVDHWVDRPEMEAPQGVQLTGTNRPRDLNTTTQQARRTGAASTAQFPDNKQPGTTPHQPEQTRHQRAQQNSSATQADTRLTPNPDPAGPTAADQGLPGGKVFGGHGGGETPGPIPNPEVKPSSADGTARETVWESRTPPDKPSKRGPAPPGRASLSFMALFADGGGPDGPLSGLARGLAAAPAVPSQARPPSSASCETRVPGE